MDYFSLEPEVAGGLGPNTILDHRTHPPIVERLHYVFDGWAGDALVESFPCYLAIERACDRFVELGFTGFELRDVEVSVSGEFTDRHPSRRLPPFRWLHVDGLAGVDDFGSAPDSRLVVSHRVLRALESLGFGHAIVKRWPERSDDRPGKATSG